MLRPCWFPKWSKRGVQSYPLRIEVRFRLFQRTLRGSNERNLPMIGLRWAVTVTWMGREVGILSLASRRELLRRLQWILCRTLGLYRLCFWRRSRRVERVPIYVAQRIPRSTRTMTIEFWIRLWYSVLRFSWRDSIFAESILAICFLLRETRQARRCIRRLDFELTPFARFQVIQICFA